MKRLLFTALLWTVALHAQGRMGAVHSSPSARVSPGASHASAPVSRGFASRSAPVSRFTARPGVRTSPFNTASGRRPFVGNRNFVAGRGFHHRGHFARPFFFVGLNGSCLNGFTTSGFCDNFGYPYYPLYTADTSYTEPAPVYDSSADTQAALSYQVERLSREVDDLRESERQPRQNNDDDKPPVSRPSDMSAPNDPPKALVFKDGHQILVENYVISGNTMWIIDNGHMKKVSLNDIDTAATQKANSDNDFRIRR
jgi:hypothetical protein